MTDDAPKPVALDYARPPARQSRRRVWFLVLLLSVGHLLVTTFSLFVWWGEGLAVVTPILLLPFYIAAELGLLRDVPLLFNLFVLVPINSLLYGMALAAAVLIVRRRLFKKV